MNIGLILVLTGGAVLTVGDVLMKEWIMKDNKWFFIGGIIIYIAGLIFLSFSYKYKNIAVASMILVIFNIVTLLIVSWFIFGENLTGWQIFGMILGVASIIALEV